MDPTNTPTHRRTATSILKSIVTPRSQHKKSQSVSEPFGSYSPSKHIPSTPRLPENGQELQPPRAPFLDFDDIAPMSPVSTQTAPSSRSASPTRGSLDLSRFGFDFKSKRGKDSINRPKSQYFASEEKGATKSKRQFDFSILKNKDRNKDKSRPSSRHSKEERKETNKENQSPKKHLPSTQSTLSDIRLPPIQSKPRSNTVVDQLARPAPRSRPISYHSAQTKSQAQPSDLDRYAPVSYVPTSQRNLVNNGNNSDTSAKPRPKSAYPGLSSDKGLTDFTKGRLAPAKGYGGSMEFGKGKEKEKAGAGPIPPAKGMVPSKSLPELTGKELDEAFERVLDARDVPEYLRGRMRTLEPRVKCEFIAKEKLMEMEGSKTDAASKPVSNPPPNAPISPTKASGHGSFFRRPAIPLRYASQDQGASEEQEPPKKAKSKTFINKDKMLGAALNFNSPTKKKRSDTLGAKSDLSGILLPPTGSSHSLPPGEASPKHQGASKITPSEYMEFLKKAAVKPRPKSTVDGILPVHDEGMKDVPVEKLHKLRLVLRNERVCWVEEFLQLGGFEAVVKVLRRCMDIEWREDHEDSILHETLLCLKALSMSSRALTTLSELSTTLFTELLDMIFDDENKGPSEFTTRNIVFGLLFTYISAATPTERASRARNLMFQLSDKQPADTAPPDFIKQMHQPRPYKKWFRECYNVTKEVFWIFIHHQNVMSPPDQKNYSASLGLHYFNAHFPPERPPVPSAPHVGGVEFEATNYLATHLDIINAIVASLPTRTERNQFRLDMKNSGWEKVMGMALRTCKEKLHSCIHAGLNTWIQAAAEDNWDTGFVRQGPPRHVPAPRERKVDAPPKLQVKGLPDNPSQQNLKGSPQKKDGEVVAWNF